MKFKGFAMALAAGLVLPVSFSGHLYSADPLSRSSDGGTDASQIDARVQDLIRLLADPSYSKRQNARTSWSGSESSRSIDSMPRVLMPTPK